jgi:hypothetical protein
MTGYPTKSNQIKPMEKMPTTSMALKIRVFVPVWRALTKTVC